MKRVIGVFAHPDDEALGPSGTLAKLAQDHEVYLICVTSGEAAGTTPEEKRIIGQTRREEVTKAAEILGIKEVFFLGYEDGYLCNNIYHKLAQEIAKKVELLRPEILLTFEIRGVSGHIDHITTSLVTTYVFKKYSFVKKLMYYVTTKKESDLMQDYFIYFPLGFEKTEVDEIVDITSVWQKKLKAMHCHKSQINDVERVLRNKKDLPREEYFLIKTKKE
ncbi:MAG TPA: PIG-L deacetylase family protein [Patescibacteria group bacterium]|nr:PIG-L deacetylase family protein [Patescibacteria group bacterium]